MLVSVTRRELIDNILKAVSQLVMNSRVKNAVIEELKKRNIPNPIGLYSQSIPLDTVNDEILCLLSYLLYEESGIAIINPERYFTNAEISKIKKYKLGKKEATQLPLVLENVVELSDGQWSTVQSIQDIVSWYESNIVNYNFDTQREASYKDIGDSLIKKPTVNWNSVDQIAERIIQGLFYSNYITLNILKNGEDNKVYDAEKKALLINKGSKIDILDGFHRSLGMIKALSQNPNINYNTGVMITNFDVPTANSFIRQEDHRNKINARHIKANNVENLFNEIVKQLNTNLKSEIRGKITSDIAVLKSSLAYTLTDIMSDSLEILFKKEVKTRRDMSKLSSYLIEFYNEVYGINYDGFDKQNMNSYAFGNMFVVYNCIAKKLHNNNNWVDELENIIDKLNKHQEDVVIKFDLTNNKLRITKKLITNINEFIDNLEVL